MDISRQSPTVADNHIRKLLSMETNYLQSVMENTYLELDQNRSFFSLQESVGKSQTRANEKRDLKEREIDLRKEISSLRVLISKKTRDAETHILESNLLIAKLKDELTEAKRSTKGEEEFVSRLERVRESERVALFDEEEREMVEKRDNYKRDIEYEHRVTVEIESWLNERRSHLKELLQFWIEKSKVDIATKEGQLQELIANREADLKRKEEAEQRLKEARQYVEAELVRREQIRIEQEEQAVQIKTTVRIQAWWRMMMVRRGLGQFKKKKTNQPEPKKNGLRK
eukprot:TCALIF_00069-PA protein Name:"Similar to Iqcg IQ domain-containing protein G (Rattus norvegicus)" AED:0.23 eAED:0.23 QI:0/0.33/0/0.5/1/1/4/0/284